MPLTSLVWLLGVAGQLDDIVLPLPAPIEEFARGLPLAGDVARPTEHRFLGAVLPTPIVNTDEGVGGTLLLALHHHYKGSVPLRDDLSVKLVLTHKLVQKYELRWESVDVLDLPLRSWLRVGYHSTVTDNHCGLGADVLCDAALGEQQADALGLAAGSVARSDVVRRYYLKRYIRVLGEGTLRWRIFDEAPWAVDVAGGWRASRYLPGDLFERSPYPHSLYAGEHPRGEEGTVSTPLAGVLVDARDREAAPTRGVLFEASARAAAPFFGSDWTFFGVNASFAVYAPLTPRRDLVLASRVLGDVIVGDAPTYELGTVGGLRETSAFGGQTLGRGIRDHRYAGALKVVVQEELRQHIVDVLVVENRLGLEVAGFLDAAWIGARLDHLDGDGPGDDPLRVVWSGGGGIRILVNRGFVMRFDVGASPFEQQGLALSSSVGLPL